MTLENASHELLNRLTTLRGSVDELLILITETRPYEHSLAHRFEHTSREVLGRLDAALNAATMLQQIAQQFDHGQALAALGTCHAEFNPAAEKFCTELKSFDWLQDLYALGNEHPAEWMGWVTSIKATLDQCSLLPVQEALLKCWQSLLVSSGAMSTRHIKNIDRHVITAEAEAGLNEPS